VVFATPPFWLAKAMTFTLLGSRLNGGSGRSEEDARVQVRPPAPFSSRTRAV
jgi:hypothetical protein